MCAHELIYSRLSANKQQGSWNELLCLSYFLKGLILYPLLQFAPILKWQSQGKCFRSYAVQKCSEGQFLKQM